MIVPLLSSIRWVVVCPWNIFAWPYCVTFWFHTALDLCRLTATTYLVFILYEGAFCSSYLIKYNCWAAPVLHRSSDSIYWLVVSISTRVTSHPFLPTSLHHGNHSAPPASPACLTPSKRCRFLIGRPTTRVHGATLILSPRDHRDGTDYWWGLWC